jgi:hypothetical protein
MLKKIIMSIFVGAILTASMTASATGNESAKNSRSTLDIANSTINKDTLTQVAGINSAEMKNTVSQPTNKSEPTMPTEWLLTMALFGFVMLSNRSGV